MIETFAVLLCAHALADFVLQFDWMVRRKAESPVFLLHGAIALATAMAALGSTDMAPLIALTGVHLLIDAVKLRYYDGGLTAFLVDQLAHLMSLFVVAWLVPGLWAGGIWAALSQPSLGPPVMMVVAGAVLAVRAGQFVVQLLMKPLTAELEAIHADTKLTVDGPDPAEAKRGAPMPRSLAEGGKLIGLLERSLIFVMVITGQTAGIGFLIAAKSVLRFGTVGDDRALSEYVIIGTLASFSWAIIVAFFTVVILNHLPLLGISVGNP